MTFSIVARDAATGAFGIAVATRFFAVGSLCPHAEGGVGALATQALINPLYGHDGLAMLRLGMPAQQVLQALVDADPGRDARQLHLQDAKGRIAARVLEGFDTRLRAQPGGVHDRAVIEAGIARATAGQTASRSRATSA